MVMHIAIEGNISSGKSTAISNLIQVFKKKGVLVSTYPEPILEWTKFGPNNENLLKEMYAKPTTQSFVFQLGALLTKCEQLRNIAKESVVIVERSLKAQEMVFIPLLREKRYLKITENDIIHRYMNLMMEWKHLTPNVIVYLRVSPEVARKRILLRGRKEEEGIDLDYLQKLHEKYEFWLRNQDDVITIDADILENLDAYTLYDKIKPYFPN